MHRVTIQMLFVHASPDSDPIHLCRVKDHRVSVNLFIADHGITRGIVVDGRITVFPEISLSYLVWEMIWRLEK